MPNSLSPAVTEIVEKEVEYGNLDLDGLEHKIDLLEQVKCAIYKHTKDDPDNAEMARLLARVAKVYQPRQSPGKQS